MTSKKKKKKGRADATRELFWFLFLDHPLHINTYSIKRCVRHRSYISHTIIKIHNTPRDKFLGRVCRKHAVSNGGTHTTKIVTLEPSRRDISANSSLGVCTLPERISLLNSFDPGVLFLKLSCVVLRRYLVSPKYVPGYDIFCWFAAFHP